MVVIGLVALGFLQRTSGFPFAQLEPNLWREITQGERHTSLPIDKYLSDQVFQLADVSRQFQGCKSFEKLWSSFQMLSRMQGTVFRQKVLHKRFNVRLPLAQGWHANGKNVEALEQIGAKPALDC